ncbi:helix-turn-helix domain-containing protein [Aeribacillus composti]|uniref:helix-turn-helix domain-containing protein n=1 Tax=Aeribacillus TaxID=1055323 RepID=UPI000A40F9A4|nr:MULTISPECIES: helix-turn-helix domain-containing protein [Aeribacillus]MED0717550.1 helix-turn-helix domain-containing protein [Aeribacillus composti]MED0747577.1 helix-turn-helix domain-containing protein [Aeribacillus composti]
MTKGRKTTWNERIQIVLDCLGNGKDYKKTAETYEVSYQQVYQWVKKYENGKEEALKDKRGRKKEEAELSPIAYLFRSITRTLSAKFNAIVACFTFA